MKITHNKVGQNLNISDAKEGNKSSGVNKPEAKAGATSTKTLEKTSSSETSAPVRFSEQAQL
ncbi:MAG: flagellar biosynthesis anti-sigma factor FlgM, partial [Bdellovibrionaceae bacterium]|nr:flagellar biosynthesis anti-sigma factor FlgM [Pseudobdellovibrionaceae bacterium]